MKFDSAAPEWLIRFSLLILSLLAVSFPVTSAEFSKPGTRKMAALLEKLASEAQPMENPFLSRQRVAALQTAFAQNPTMSNSPEMQFKYATELLNAGDNQTALDFFKHIEDFSRGKPDLWSAANQLNLGLDEAICYMRMGEQINCLSNHNADSCLVPIHGGGIHKWPESSRSAIGVLTNLLERFPENLPAKWLLNIASMTVGDYPGKVSGHLLIPTSVFNSKFDIKHFVDVAAPAGLAVNELSGGSVVEDFDGDGLLDVMVTSIGFHDQMHFFHNNGDGTFSDRTGEAGLTGLTGGLNLITGDFNNDGFVDVFILRGAWMREAGKFPNSLLKNNGDGTFEDVTEAAGVLSFHPTQTAVWFDFDGDGWLDLFIGNESLPGQPAHRCELYRNNHDGTFTEMAAAAGLAIRAYVKGVTAGDFNNDGRPDLYLSILGRPNMLCRNDGPKSPDLGPAGGWKFTEVGAQAGVQMPLNSFPTWFFDYDNDGWEDIFVTGYKIQDVGDIAADYLGLPSHGERARLYRNRGDGTFADVTHEVHLDHVLHAMGCNFGDLDNDGWLDFYLGTGDPDLLTLVPNRMFRNKDGLYFQDVTTSGGFGNIQKGHGVSFADINNDGEQDVFEKMGGAVSSDIYPSILFLNPGHGNHWLKLQLVGVKANRSAIGARLRIDFETKGATRSIYRTVSTGGSFGCNPLRQEIGLAQATKVQSLEIRWPGSGTIQKFTALDADHCYRIREDSASPEVVKLKTFSFSPAVAAHHHP